MVETSRLLLPSLRFSIGSPRLQNSVRVFAFKVSVKLKDRFRKLWWPAYFYEVLARFSEMKGKPEP
jgi:hypothetical protein